jgi:hypothetical protein
MRFDASPSTMHHSASRKNHMSYGVSRYRGFCKRRCKVCTHASPGAHGQKGLILQAFRPVGRICDREAGWPVLGAFPYARNAAAPWHFLYLREVNAVVDSALPVQPSAAH